MLWSILIAAIPERYHTAHKLLYSLLEDQHVSRIGEIELIYLLDNKRRSVGAKRNALLDSARGEYISFIDDDDMVASDYVSRIRHAIDKARKETPHTDVICFKQRATLAPHGIIHECEYSLEHFKKREPTKRRVLEPIHLPDGSVRPGALRWTGPPAHTMIWRRELLNGIRFPEKNFGEDVDWVDAACTRAASEIQIGGEPAYFYLFDAERSATR